MQHRRVIGLIKPPYYQIVSSCRRTSQVSMTHPRERSHSPELCPPDEGQKLVNLQTGLITNLNIPPFWIYKLCRTSRLRIQQLFSGQPLVLPRISNKLTNNVLPSARATSSNLAISLPAIPFCLYFGETINFSTLPRKGPVSVTGMPSITYPANSSSPVLGSRAICMMILRCPSLSSLTRSSHHFRIRAGSIGGRKPAVV